MLSAHSGIPLGLAAKNPDTYVTFTIEQVDQAQAMTPSTNSDQEKQPRKLVDIEGAEEEWILGKKYLEARLCPQSQDVLLEASKRSHTSGSQSQ